MVLQSVGFDYRLPREELKAALKTLETENKESSGENREVILGRLKWQDKLGKRKARSRKFTLLGRRVATNLVSHSAGRLARGAEKRSASPGALPDSCCPRPPGSFYPAFTPTETLRSTQN